MKVLLIGLLMLFVFSPAFAQKEMTVPKIKVQVPIQEVSIIARRYDFLPNQIVVRKDQPVRLYLTSIDTTHGFSLPD
jgi:heme/copper-type cytochrome/quinol oxidase subunit 2